MVINVNQSANAVGNDMLAAHKRQLIDFNIPGCEFDVAL